MHPRAAPYSILRNYHLVSPSHSATPSCHRDRQRRHQHAVAFNIGAVTAIVIAHRYCYQQHRPHTRHSAQAFTTSHWFRNGISSTVASATSLTGRVCSPCQAQECGGKPSPLSRTALQPSILEYMHSHVRTALRHDSSVRAREHQHAITEQLEGEAAMQGCSSTCTDRRHGFMRCWRLQSCSSQRVAPSRVVKSVAPKPYKRSGMQHACSPFSKTDHLVMNQQQTSVVDVHGAARQRRRCRAQYNPVVPLHHAVPRSFVSTEPATAAQLSTSVVQSSASAAAQPHKRNLLQRRAQAGKFAITASTF